MKVYLYSFILLFSHCLFAQVGINTTTPHASSILDINSTSGGLLIPRMTQAQKNAILNPATGLLIYQTDFTTGFWYYTGSAWELINANGWSTTGDALTNIATNKIGTVDAVDLSVVTNNTESIRIASNGNIGAGTASPNAKLHVVSSSPVATVYTDGFEDNTIAPFTTGGNQNWTLQTNYKNTGTYAAMSGAITHNQSSKIEYITAAIPSQGGIVSFSYRVDTDTSDKLSFYIDNVLQNSWGGNYSWASVSFDLTAGAHTLKWEYTKDASVTSNSDKVYIDDVLVTAKALPALNITDGNQIAGRVLISDATGKATWGIPTPAPITDTDWLWQTGSLNADPIYHQGNVFIGYGATSTTKNLQVSNGLTFDTKADVGSVEYFLDGNNELKISHFLTTQTDAGQNLGSSSKKWGAVYAANGTINTSDQREKENIQPMRYGLREILKLNPISFQWKVEKFDDYILPKDKKKTKLGFSAQEIQKVVPEVVVDKEWFVDGEHPEKGLQKVPTETLGVCYNELIAVTIKAIQEQQKQIEELEATNALIKEKLKLAPRN